MSPVAEQHRLRWVLLGIIFFSIAVIATAIRIGTRPTHAWDETVLVPGSSGKKIAMVSVQGEIATSLDPFSAGGATDQAVASQIDQALDDDAVAGIILFLDTPGGGVVASDEISKKVREADAKKPVVALMDETAASGGYYIASSAREIVANPATLTGSIGVIMQMANVESLFKKVGVNYVVVKAGRYKDLGNFSRPMTPQERQVLQTLLDDVHAQFIDAVAAGRKLDRADVVKFADGRVFSGMQAKDLKMVDALGSLEDAVNEAAKLAGVPVPPGVIRPSRRFSLFDLLRSQLGVRLDGLAPTLPALRTLLYVMD